MKPSRTRTLQLLQRHVCVREWGDPAAQTLVMIHGWMDTSATFQFLVDALAGEWHVIAPDLRGFGNTQWGKESVTGYWFHDYLADLDALLDHIEREKPEHFPVDLLGHSLGGNIVSIYAGLRPTRIRKLVSLDGFGVPRGVPEQASAKAVKWLDTVKTGETLRPFATLDAVVQRLQKNDRFLTRERAQWLAQQWTQPLPDGTYALLADPAHKMPFPTVYRLEESIAIWNQVTAPTLWVGAAESHVAQWLGYGWDHPDEMAGESLHTAEFCERLEAFANLRFELMPNCSHMLHHDEPEALAGLLETFLKN